MRTRTVPLAAAALALLLAGCASEDSSETVSAGSTGEGSGDSCVLEEPVKVGAALSLTGAAASYGESQQRGLETALAALEEQEGVTYDLQVEDDELVRRLLARAAEGGRTDDTEDVIRHRLALYYEVTHPILEWYGERGILVSVDANRDADAVGRQILTALEVLRQVIERDDGSPRRAVDLTGLGAAFGARR